MTLDYLATIRNIWPGHLSTKAAFEHLQKDPGMYKVHVWLESLVQAKPKPEDSESASIGDKPDSAVQARSPSPAYMLVYLQTYVHF